MAISWLKAEETDLSANTEAGVSIVVAFRNEANNLPALLKCLEKQTVLPASLEIVFVDDHSEDNTASIIQTDIPHRVLQLEKEKGKKSAIARGILTSKNDWIITLDADVQIGPRWLAGIMSAINTTNADMLILPLIIDEGKSYIEKFQCLEFMGIVGTTAGMAMRNKPVLCNGANLAFRKEAWIAASKSRSDHRISSGDDMFLLHALKKKGKAIWIHHRDVMAITPPCAEFSSFLFQRIRWASKSAYFKDNITQLTGSIVLAVNSLIVILFSIALFNSAWWAIFLFSLSIKCLIDALLIIPTIRWFGKQHLLKYYFFLCLVYPFYSILIPAAGFFITPKWKGRTISLGADKTSSVDK